MYDGLRPGGLIYERNVNPLDLSSNIELYRVEGNVSYLIVIKNLPV